MGKADESMYTVNITGNPTTITATPDSSLILPSSSITGDSPLLDSSLNTTVKRKRRHKHAHRTDHVEIPSHSKRFNSSSNENDNGFDDEVALGQYRRAPCDVTDCFSSGKADEYEKG